MDSSEDVQTIESSGNKANHLEYSPLKRQHWERKIEQVKKPKILIICVPLGKPFTLSDICRKNEKIQDNFCFIQRS